MPQLIIFINGDFTLRENGSQVRMAEQVAFAARHFDNVAVYSYRQHPSHPWTPQGEERFDAMFRGVELIVEHRPAHVALATKAKNVVLAFLPRVGRKILRISVPGGLPRYAALRKQQDVVFWINFVDGVTTLNGQPNNMLVETHDIRFVKEAKKHGVPVYSARIVGKMRSELAMLAEANAVVMISPVDQQILGALTHNLRSFFVPSYGRLLTLPNVANATQAFDLLFVGANNSFNVDGLLSLLKNNRDWLEPRTLRIAGRVCENAIVQALPQTWPNITLLGYVDDLAPVYTSTKVVLSPVDGTGLKIKVVEALAHGKPVLGSRHSRDALPPGYEECVLPADREHLDALLNNPLSLQAAEHAARAYYDKFAKAGDHDALLKYISRQMSAGDSNSD